MKKIVVTTDFSENSKKGILFAIQLASQTDCELIFYNVVSIYMPTIWDNVYYNEFQTGELERSQSFLDLLERPVIQTPHNPVRFRDSLPACIVLCGKSGGPRQNHPASRGSHQIRRCPAGR